VKPIRIDVPHPLIKINSDKLDADAMDNEVGVQECDICIIVKESSKPHIQELIARFPKQLSCIKKVLTLPSLRTKHKTFSQRRELLSKYDLFLADDRILPMLTKALGSKFFEKKRQPVPICVTRGEEGFPLRVERILKATTMCLSGGTCVTVRAGNTSMPPSNLHSNILAICTAAPLKVPRKWANIKSISIKTTNSVALPVYNKTLEELEEIRLLAGGAKEEGANKDKSGDGESKVDGKKKRKELAAASPLARALKKQKQEESDGANDDEEDVGSTPAKKARKEIIEAKSEKKSSKKKARDDVGEEKVLKTPKESKSKVAESESSKTKSSKKKRNDSTDEFAPSEAKTPKSSKKKEQPAEDANFIPSKKFTGSKKGYVFKKSKLGLGYHRDVLPVVDKAWLASLGKRGGGGKGGRKSISHTPMKRKGNKRRSY